VNWKLDFKNISVLNLISIYFSTFGLGLFISIAFTHTGRGKIVNIICGLIFFIVSYITHILSKYNDN
jgi:hypothetical protein